LRQDVRYWLRQLEWFRRRRNSGSLAKRVSVRVASFPWRVGA
jgi:hypothetical protein